MAEERWVDAADAAQLAERRLMEVRVGERRLALSWADGVPGAISGRCNHVGGPLGQGCLDGEYVTCPWHQWKYHRRTGAGEPGSEGDQVPAYPARIEAGRVLVNLAAGTRRRHAPHAAHPLARPPERSTGAIRVVGISTTAMDEAAPRYSGSDDLLAAALSQAAAGGAETRLIRLSALRFRTCEGYYSKSARACTWPCSITQMHADDQMDQVYEALVHWADAVIVATPIRWGAASSLYFKMAERLNCVQNQVTTHDRSLIVAKAAAFIVIGGQDNVQAVAGGLLGFFAELGFQFPQYPYIASTRGWSAEDMANNVLMVQGSRELHAGAAALAERTVALARLLRDADAADRALNAKGGRKAWRTAPGGVD